MPVYWTSLLVGLDYVCVTNQWFYLWMALQITEHQSIVYDELTSLQEVERTGQSFMNFLLEFLACKKVAKSGQASIVSCRKPYSAGKTTMLQASSECKLEVAITPPQMKWLPSSFSGYQGNVLSKKRNTGVGNINWFSWEDLLPNCYYGMKQWSKRAPTMQSHSNDPKLSLPSD